MHFLVLAWELVNLLSTNDKFIHLTSSWVGDVAWFCSLNLIKIYFLYIHLYSVNNLLFMMLEVFCKSKCWMDFIGHRVPSWYTVKHFLRTCVYCWTNLLLMNNIQTYFSVGFDVQFWSRLKVIKEKVKYYARAHSEANIRLELTYHNCSFLFFIKKGIFDL